MRRGDSYERSDPFYHQPEYQALETQLKASSLPLRFLKSLAVAFTNGDHGGLDYTITGVRYLRGQSITEHGLDLEKDELYISQLDHKRMERAEVIPGDVLLTIAGSIGNSCVVEGIERANINQAIVKMRPSQEAMSKYLATFLNSRLGKFQTDRLANGAVQLNVNFSEVGRLLIPLPPLDVQRALVDAMEAARAMRQSKLVEAEALLKGMDEFVLSQLGLKLPEEDHRSVFSIRLGDIKNRIDAYSNQPRFRKLQKVLLESLSAVELRTLAVEIFSGTTPTSGGNAYTDKTNGIPFVRSGEITSDGKVSENIENYLKPDIHNGMMKRSQLQKDDLLIAIVGATIGAVGVYDRSTPANINQAIAGVRLSKKVLPEFVCWYLKSGVGQAVLDFLKRPVARANINLDEVGQILVPVPSLAIQKTIADELSRRREQARRLRVEAESVWVEAKSQFERALLG